MIKKLAVVFSGLAFALSALCALNGMVLYNTIQEQQQLVIVEENGWQVVKDNDPTTSTILATVTSDDADGDGYIIVTNQFDSKDTIAIEKESYKVGDNVAVTFLNDDVVKVVKK